MIEYRALSVDELAKKADAINTIDRIGVDEEYVAMKNELNNISSIKNSYVIALFAGMMTAWGYIFMANEKISPNPYILLIIQCFIYIIQIRWSALTSLHIRIQAYIWVIYDTFYESSYISVSQAIFGPRTPTFFSRLKKIPAFYMGTANVVAGILYFGVKVVTSDTYLVYKDTLKCLCSVMEEKWQWILVLVIIVIIQIVIFVRFWNSRDGELNLIATAEVIKDNAEIINMKAIRKGEYEKCNGNDCKGETLE